MSRAPILFKVNLNTLPSNYGEAVASLGITLESLTASDIVVFEQDDKTFSAQIGEIKNALLAKEATSLLGKLDPTHTLKKASAAVKTSTGVSSYGEEFFKSLHHAIQHPRSETRLRLNKFLLDTEAAAKAMAINHTEDKKSELIVIIYEDKQHTEIKHREAREPIGPGTPVNYVKKDGSVISTVAGRLDSLIKGQYRQIGERRSDEFLTPVMGKDYFKTDEQAGRHGFENTFLAEIRYAKNPLNLRMADALKSALETIEAEHIKEVADTKKREVATPTRNTVETPQAQAAAPPTTTLPTHPLLAFFNSDGTLNHDEITKKPDEFSKAFSYAGETTKGQLDAWLPAAIETAKNALQATSEISMENYAAYLLLKTVSTENDALCAAYLQRAVIDKQLTSSDPASPHSPKSPQSKIRGALKTEWMELVYNAIPDKSAYITTLMQNKKYDEVKLIFDMLSGMGANFESEKNAARDVVISLVKKNDFESAATAMKALSPTYIKEGALKVKIEEIVTDLIIGKGAFPQADAILKTMDGYVGKTSVDKSSKSCRDAAIHELITEAERETIILREISEPKNFVQLCKFNAYQQLSGQHLHDGATKTEKSRTERLKGTILEYQKKAFEEASKTETFPAFDALNTFNKSVFAKTAELPQALRDEIENAKKTERFISENREKTNRLITSANNLKTPLTSEFLAEFKDSFYWVGDSTKRTALLDKLQSAIENKTTPQNEKDVAKQLRDIISAAVPIKHFDAQDSKRAVLMEDVAQAIENILDPERVKLAEETTVEMKRSLRFTTSITLLATLTTLKKDVTALKNDPDPFTTARADLDGLERQLKATKDATFLGKDPEKVASLDYVAKAKVAVEAAEKIYRARMPVNEAAQPAARVTPQ